MPASTIQVTPSFVERRDPARQRIVAGGSRATDPPLTTRDVADYMGLSTAWVRAAIDDGCFVPGGHVRLNAETIVVNRRRIRRILLADFRQFLQQIGWKHLPPDPRASDAT